MPYIYVITNKINGKQYVGKTTSSIEKRFKEHLSDAKRESLENRPLYRAIRKYGNENFSISELESCSLEQLEEREIYWIQKLGTFHFGYNATIGGDGKRFLDYSVLVEAYDKYGTLSAAAKSIGVDPGSVKNAVLLEGRAIRSSSEITKDMFGKKTQMFDSDQNKLNEFPSTRDAARYLVDELCLTQSYQSAERHIGEVCKGKRKRAYGFYWEYEKE